jgi:hypothetical protein
LLQVQHEREAQVQFPADGHEHDAALQHAGSSRSVRSEPRLRRSPLCCLFKSMCLIISINRHRRV